MTPHHKVLVFSPLALGLSCASFNMSWAATAMALARAGHDIQLTHQTSSNIVVSRNKAVGMVLNSDFTHLLFLDSDMSWDQPDAILRMLALDRPVICGGYLSKADDPFWTFRVKGDGRLEEIRPDPYGLIELTHAPTGFMLIQREVFTIMAMRRPDLKCNFDSVFTGPEPNHYLFFDQRLSRPDLSPVVGDTTVRFYMTDDYGFSETWTELGGQLWLYPWVTIHHWKSTPISGNLAHTLAAVGIKLPPPPDPIMPVY